jgi:hypothetical protein
VDSREFIVSTGLSDLSRRDNRTKPGVLTRGMTKRTSRPEGGGRTEAPEHTFDQNYLTPLSSFVPRSLNYGGQAGRVVMWAFSWG